MQRLNQDEVLSYISKNNIQALALDFFDTVAYRTVHPEYVKLLAAKRFILKTGINMSPKNFYELRAGFEIKLCNINQKKFGSLEFDLDELGEIIAEYFKGRIKVDKKELQKVFVDTEIQIELEVLRINEDILELIEEVNKRGMDIYILSDFYIPRKYFDKIIKHLGINKYVKEIYVSCDFKKTKKSGDLYKDVLTQLNVKNGDIIMIGDNQIADVDMAEKNGIKGFLIENDMRASMYKSFWERKFNSELSRYDIEKSLKKILKKYKKLQFKEIALVLLNFTEGLYLQLVKENFKEVYFCSKEGYFLKKVFDYFQKVYIGEERIKSHYIKVSRRSTFLPSLVRLEEEKFETIFRQYVNLSVEQFLKNFNFNKEEENKILSPFKNYKKEIKDFNKSKEFSMLKKGKAFKESYEKNRLEQKKLFKEYIFKKSIIENPSRIAIVDVGWKGTIQDHIYKVLDQKVSISGKYLGLNITENQKLNLKNSKEGIIFVNNPKSRFYDVYIKLTSLFEILLAAPHGSAMRYKKGKNGVEAVCEEIKEEVVMYKEKTEQIQEGMFNCFQDVLEVSRTEYHLFNKHSDVITKFFLRILCLPKIKELRYFKNMKHFENFALFDYSTFARKEKLFSSAYFKILVKLLLGFKWFFAQEWGAFIYYNYNIYFLRKIFGFFLFRKIVKREKL